MTSQDLLAELQTIFKEDYHITLSDVDTSELGNALVDAFQLLDEIDTDPDCEEYD
jgi:hypothetical protein